MRTVRTFDGITSDRNQTKLAINKFSNVENVEEKKKKKN